MGNAASVNLGTPGGIPTAPPGGVLPAGASGAAGTASSLASGGLDPSKLSPSNIPPLPGMGNLNNQLSQGQALVGKLSGFPNISPGNIQDLLGAGVTTLANAVGGEGGTLIRSMVSIGTAVASGAAVGGPFGAAGGAIVGIGESILSDLTGQAPTYEGLVIGSSAGTERLYTLVGQWQTQNSAPVSGEAQGQTFLEYYMSQNPPQSTLRPNLLWSLLPGGDDSSNPQYNQFTGEYPRPAVSQGGEIQPPLDGNGNPMSITGPGQWPPSTTDQADAQTYIGFVQPVDSSLFWGWAQPTSNPSDTQQYAESFKEAGGGSQELWLEDTVPAPGLSASSIMASALRRAPDPMYFAQDLYIAQSLPSGGEVVTLVQNTGAASAVATVLGMLAVGASTRAIVSELLLQQHILYLLDYAQSPDDAKASNQVAIDQLEADLDPSNLSAAAQAGNPYSKSQIAAMQKQLTSLKKGKTPTPKLPPLFRQLVEDYIALAHAEAKSSQATMTDVILANRPHEPTLTGATSKESATQIVQHYLDKYLGA